MNVLTRVCPRGSQEKGKVRLPREPIMSDAESLTIANSRVAIRATFKAFVDLGLVRPATRMRLPRLKCDGKSNLKPSLTTARPWQAG
jgi:hypothetical protein